MRDGTPWEPGTTTMMASDTAPASTAATSPTASDPSAAEASSGESGATGTDPTTTPPTASVGGESSSGPVPDGCVSEDMAYDVLIGTDADFIELPMQLEPDVEYGYVRIEVDFTVGDWNGTCYNPAAGSNPDNFPVFQELMTLKRGDHWCKGGTAFGLTTQGGDYGPVQSKTFYKAEVHQGSGCGESDFEAEIFNEDHSLQVGMSYTATLVYDRVASTLTVDLGPGTHQGPIHEDVHIVGSAAYDWTLVGSFDGGYLGCYGEPGDDRCCHIPSLSWHYARIAYTACPDPP